MTKGDYGSMIYGNYETNYMISLLASTLNQRKPATAARATNWRELYYLGEYHRITNIAFYSLLGVWEEVPQIWEKHFSKSFRKWVSIHTLQQREANIVMNALENDKIKHMMLNDWVIKEYYPQSDMRIVEDIKILIPPKKEKEIRRLMLELGYHFEGQEEANTLAFYKTIHCRVIFYEELFPKNRKFNPYFSKIWNKVILEDGKEHEYRLGEEDFYILLTAQICNAYAKCEVDVRAILDIHLYLKNTKKLLDWTYIDMALSGLEIYQLSKYLEEVGELWLGTYEEKESQICISVEAYLWSKGVYGRKISTELLPLISDMEKWRLQDERRARIKETIDWWLPPLEHMKGMYPSLYNVPVLLPFCWGSRLIRKLYFAVKVRGIHIYHLHLKEPEDNTDDVLAAEEAKRAQMKALYEEIEEKRGNVSEDGIVKKYVNENEKNNTEYQK